MIVFSAFECLFGTAICECLYVCEIIQSDEIYP